MGKAGGNDLDAGLAQPADRVARDQRGGDVDIVDRSSQKRIADRPAHEPSVAGAIVRFERGHHRLRGRRAHPIDSPRIELRHASILSTKSAPGAAATDLPASRAFDSVIFVTVDAIL